MRQTTRDILREEMEKEEEVDSFKLKKVGKSWSGLGDWAPSGHLPLFIDDLLALSPFLLVNFRSRPSTSDPCLALSMAMQVQLLLLLMPMMMMWSPSVRRKLGLVAMQLPRSSNSWVSLKWNLRNSIQLIFQKLPSASTNVLRSWMTPRRNWGKSRIHPALKLRFLTWADSGLCSLKGVERTQKNPGTW